MAPPRPSRYSWWPLKVVDGLSVVLTAPLIHTLSLAGSCYCLTTFDSTSFIMLFLRFAVVGPVLVLLALVSLVPGVVGWVVWMALNTHAAHLIQPFYYHSPPRHARPARPTPATHPRRVTVCSANVLLCPEVVSRFNNCPNVLWRTKEIGSRLLRQDCGLNLHLNLKPPVCREEVVVTQLPEVDVFILQEVVERWQGREMVGLLGTKYPHCLYDVGVHSSNSNKFCCGSGLFLASKYPIMDAVFHPYTHHSHYGCLVGLGVLLAKLDLGTVVRSGRELAAVGYVANTHTQAYQGEKNIISEQLSEASSRFKRYIKDTLDTRTEILMFGVLGGDFNADNISKGDVAVQNHPLWTEFVDPCQRGPGVDQAWAIGTEHRQKQLHHPAIRHPSAFRSVLLDDVMRRHFILDADVQMQTLELMRVRPRVDSAGRVVATPEGGRRRIDRLAALRGCKMAAVSYWFSTVIAGLTDHVPVIMMLQEEEEEEEG
ncbi:sphingomyelin phosphodiesterase 5-like [Scylla paramamosain]|uniref:sphingomyelin phosphodiesterase 5-like n=1 Tax=Scylla paramamosain TaxID=85552 RepID=UPI00308326A1